MFISTVIEFALTKSWDGRYWVRYKIQTLWWS